VNGDFSLVKMFNSIGLEKKKELEKRAFRREPSLLIN